MKLYDIRNDYLGLLALADEGGLTHEAIADTVEALDHEFADKARNCLMVVKHLEGQANTAKAEYERLKALSDSYARQADSLKEYVRLNMEALNKDKLDLGIFKLTLKKPTITADVLDESKIPAQYFTVMPETKKLDKRTLLADLKDHPIEGAELKPGKRALLIK